jgi:probable lipoprotein NlpC
LDKITKIFKIQKILFKFLIFNILIFIVSCSGSKKMQNSAERISKKQKNAKVEQVIGVARSYIGTPYKYGGSTQKGMDCSGLLQVSFGSANINIPRTSNEQSKYGKEVKINKLKPGDLLFFSSDAKKKRTNKIGHVGMVTSVQENKVVFVHSTVSAGVREDDLHAAYWKKLFIKARRPL